MPGRDGPGELSIARTGESLQTALNRFSGRCVGLVPTMGALHDGHLSLLRAARQDCDVVVASLFVNPTQFGEGEDFAEYPRDEARDFALFRENGVDVVFAPGVESIYPDGVGVTVLASELAEGLCGASRPGHFDGVVTVVAALFEQCAPERAYFGEKDYQQLKVIERMADDHGFRVEVVGVPIVREPDGLAMSSRNAYLTPGQRTRAPELFRTLRAMADRIGPEADLKALCSWGRTRLLEAGFEPIDYLEVCDGTTLRPASVYRQGLRLFVAAHLGETRLIDNLPVE